MAGAAEIDKEDLEITIKGLLVSKPTVIKANVLQRECEEELGKPFPFRQLGFPTFLDYLRSIPAVVQLEPHNSFNPDVYPVQSRASSHIDQLVSRQRVPPARRRGVARRGAYNSRPAAIRRRLARPLAPPNRQPGPNPTRPNQVDRDTVEPHRVNRDITVQHLDPKFMRKILWDLVKKLAVSWKSGINVRDLEGYMTRNYDKRDLTRNGIHSADDLLSHVEGMVERGDTKVYPKLAGGSNNTDWSRKVNGIPAGLEDDFDDFNDEDMFYDEEAERDSEEELSKQAIQLWSQALGMEENGSSSRTPVPGGETSAVDAEQEGLDLNVGEPEDDSNISKGMINNFRKILDRHPDGIWASQLQQLYHDQFRASLDLLDLGYMSVVSLASSLPSVFTFCREGPDDWKLYDARYVTQESLDIQENGGGVTLSENERYIPQTIIEKIKKLLDDYPNGFRSTDLLQLYRETFRKPLDLEVLGFNTLEEFLMILKNDVTLKKVLNYYLLLPKHKLVSHEALQPPKPDERLNVPAEALCVPIPENVMRLGEEIPLQELPPVQMDPDPDKPLLELEVRVAEVMSPAFFYMTLGSTYEELEKMMDDLDKFYQWEEDNFKIPLPHIAMNLYCAAKYEGFWHRAKITRIKNHGIIEIEFIDYGTPAKMKSSELRYLSKEFAYLPAQAICAKLMGLKTMNGEAKFPPEVCTEFLNFVDSKRLVAHVYQVAARVRHRQERMQLEVILFDVENPNQEIVVNDYLVEKGLARPISQMQESPTEFQQPVGDLLPESDLISLQANGPSLSLPSASTSLPENVSSSLLGNASTSLPASSVATLLKTLLNDLSSNDSSPVPSPRIPSLSLRPNKKTQEEKKPRGPPPGFERIPIDLDFDLSSPPVSTAPTHSSSSQTNSQPSNSLSNEAQRILINNFYLMSAAQLYPQLLLQEQYNQQNVYQPNPSNMPFGGPPLFHSQQNGSQRSLTYGSVVPPQNAYHNPHSNVYRQQEYRTVPNNYMQMNPPVPVIHPAQANYVLMNAPGPNQYFGFHPTNSYGQGDFMFVPPSVQAACRQPSPVPAKSKFTPTPPPATRRPVSSPAPAYTPVTVPEWPPTNLPASFTSAPARTKIVSNSYDSVPASPKQFESPDVNQPSRPCTPLTPASAEVAKICKLRRPKSSTSNNSESQSAKSPNVASLLDNISSKAEINTNPVDNTSSKSQINTSPLDPTSGKLQINTSPLDNISSKSQINPSSLDNTLSNSQICKGSDESAISNFQTEKIEHNPRNNLDPPLDTKGYPQPHTKVNEIPLPLDIDIKKIPLPPPSPEKLYSAISSPVDSLICTSPLKEESSDDYASASENVEEAKQQLSNLTLTEQYSIPALKPPCDPSEDIPDSWENLDLDDTPAKAANFSEDFSQPLNLIIKNIESESTLKANNPVEKSVSEVKSQESLFNFQAPANWKDFFNPDIISSSERVDNNNKVKGKSPLPAKFNVKKIPVQEIEVQGKFFHLLYINKTPAVIALEFFKQFSTSNSPAVSEKVIEVSHNKMYYISKAKHPDILTELNKVTDFWGGVQKKIVIRLNKVRVINLSDIPQCLKVLNVSNKPLLDDLEKIANELA